MTIDSFTPDQLCALDEMAVLHIRGEEARSFMQSQLTNSVDSLGAEEATLAGFCQAQGRLQATFIVWADPANEQNLYAMVRRNIAETVRKRLSMFLLRTKAELVLSEARVYGVWDAPTTVFTLPATTYALKHLDENHSLIAAPSATSDDTGRAWLVAYGPEEHRPLLAHQSASSWQAADMAAGLPWIEEGNYENLLPQDINLDIIGGVSFKKGCFPGQEVVARLHYRSTAKRRAALGIIKSATPLAITVSSDVFTADAPDRPIGRIINSAYDDQAEQQVLLMQVPIANIEEQSLQLADGTAIELQPLPYKWEIDKY